MAIYSFRRYVTFGCGDSGDDVDFELEVTEAEYALLERHEKAGDCLGDIDAEAPELLCRIYAESEDESRQELLDCGEDPDDLDSYSYGVDFGGTETE